MWARTCTEADPHCTPCTQKQAHARTAQATGCTSCVQELFRRVVLKTISITCLKIILHKILLSCIELFVPTRFNWCVEIYAERSRSARAILKRTRKVLDVKQPRIIHRVVSQVEILEAQLTFLHGNLFQAR